MCASTASRRAVSRSRAAISTLARLDPPTPENSPTSEKVSRLITDDGEEAVVAAAARRQQGGGLLVEAVAVEHAGERFEVLVQDVGVDEPDRGFPGERDEHDDEADRSTDEMAKAMLVDDNLNTRTARRHAGNHPGDGQPRVVWKTAA